MNLTPKKKIFILIPSTSGHINPVSGLVYELCHRHNVDCVFYGNVENRELIERTGATFRLFSHRNFAVMEPPPLNERNKQKRSIILSFMNLMLDCGYAVIPDLMQDIAKDKPDLIVYDAGFGTIKYLAEILKKQNSKVKFVEFYPNFVFTKELFAYMPIDFKVNFSNLFGIVSLVFRQIAFSMTFGLFIINPLGFLMKKTERLKIVSVFPELHPRLSDYDQTHKFVGQCASEEARGHELKDDPELKALLDMFPVKASETNSSGVDGSKLIFMSLGTVFHNNTFVFETVIEAFREFDKKPDRRLKSEQFRVLMSVGVPGFKSLNDKITQGKLQLPANILLRPRVPQLDVLKRADLFITHCGMNSTSEAIKYGVPIVAIPIDGDQPLVAMRTCQELFLGIRLDPMKLKVISYFC